MLTSQWCVWYVWYVSKNGVKFSLTFSLKVQHICLCSLLWLLSRGSGSARIVINSTTKKPAILIGAYILGLSLIHSIAGSNSMTGMVVLSKLVLVSFLAIGTLFTVDLRKWCFLLVFNCIKTITIFWIVSKQLWSFEMYQNDHDLFNCFFASVNQINY